MRITAYKTTDGEIFELEIDAINHQAEIDAAILKSEAQSYIFQQIQSINSYALVSINKVVTDTIIAMFYEDYLAMKDIAIGVDSILNDDSSDSIPL